MTTTRDPAKAAGVSDAAVRAATGKGWDEWFAILDAFDVGNNSHKAAAIHLSEVHACPDWWSQMVTVGYEQERGLRKKHETPQGYQMGVSRTFPVPVVDLYGAWSDEQIRARWLPEPIAIRKATLDKSMRITWPDRISLSVNFWVKADTKSQVQVIHEKLPDEAAVATLKPYWREALTRLARVLER